MDKQAAFPKKS